MITIKTFVNIADNCGARIGECIKVLRSKYYNAKLADLIIVAVKVSLIGRRVKRHDVITGVVIRMRKPVFRKDLDCWISFNENAMIYLEPKKGPSSTRMFGPGTQELRLANQTRILSKLPMII